MQTVREDQKKRLVLALVGLLFSIGIAITLNRNQVACYRSDIFLRWYASKKLLFEGRDLYDAQNAQEVTTFSNRSLGLDCFHAGLLSARSLAYNANGWLAQFYQ